MSNYDLSALKTRLEAYQMLKEHGAEAVAVKNGGLPALKTRFIAN
ncbi:hypothetical protein [Endozoicomonas atrinae]